MTMPATAPEERVEEASPELDDVGVTVTTAIVARDHGRCGRRKKGHWGED